MTKTEAATSIIVALIGAGLLQFVRDAYRTRKAAKQRELSNPAAIQEVDASLLVVAKARDELEEDNRRLRLTLSEERHRHAEDRDRWDREKGHLYARIDDLELKLRGLLAELEDLRARAQKA